MDDARTQRTLDALADLYLTGQDAPTPDRAPNASNTPNKTQNQPSGKAQGHSPSAPSTPPTPSYHSAANTGPHKVAPLRLPPKLRIRHAPAPLAVAATGTAAYSKANSATATPSTSSTPLTRGPARPWREVRQERQQEHAQRDAQQDAPFENTPFFNAMSEQLDGLIDDNAIDAAPQEQSDRQGSLSAHMQQAHLDEQAADAAQTDEMNGASQACDDDGHAGREDEGRDEDIQSRDTQDEQDDYSPYAFPGSASRSSDVAASGVMSDEADGPRPRLREPGESLPCQAVFLGNLPGFAGPWLAQYAQLLAVKKQRVAIIHMAGEVAELQLVSPLGVPHVDVGQQGESIIDLFEQLTQDEHCPLTHWLVHLPMPLTNTSRELGHDFDGWTLLTGADDAAVASSVQWLEQMLEGDRRHALRQVGVSVMGSDPSRGHAVANKLSASAEGELSQPVALLPSRRQMAPVNVQELGVFGPAMEMWAELVAYLTSFEGASQASNTNTASASDTAVRSAVLDEATPDSTYESAIEETDQPTPSVSRASFAPRRSAAEATGSDSFRLPDSRRVSPQRQSPAQLKAMQGQSHEEAQPPSHEQGPAVVVEQIITTGASAAGMESTQTRSHTTSQPVQPQEHSPSHATAAASCDSPEAESSAAGDTLNYLRWIAPGAMSLEARCPYKPSVEMALDQQGVVHIMAGSTQGVSTHTKQDLHSLAMDLLEVRQWAMEHLQLLSLTQRQCRFDLAAQPVVHLFAADGIAMTTMVRSLGQSIKLHLLQEAHIGHQSTWVASPLN